MAPPHLMYIWLVSIRAVEGLAASSAHDSGRVVGTSISLSFFPQELLCWRLCTLDVNISSAEDTALSLLWCRPQAKEDPGEMLRALCAGQPGP